MALPPHCLLHPKWAEVLGPASLSLLLKEIFCDATLAEFSLATQVMSREVRFCLTTRSFLQHVEAQEHSRSTKASDFTSSGLSAQEGRGSPPVLWPSPHPWICPGRRGGSGGDLGVAPRPWALQTPGLVPGGREGRWRSAPLLGDSATWVPGVDFTESMGSGAERTWIHSTCDLGQPAQPLWAQVSALRKRKKCPILLWL